MIVKSYYAALTSLNSAATTQALGISWRGTITRLIVKQVTGTLAGYTVDIYDCDPADTPEGYDADIHKIIGTITVAAAASTAANYDMIPAYENQEVRDDPSLMRESRIYIKVTPAGTGDKVFVIGYTTTTWMSS